MFISYCQVGRFEFSFFNFESEGANRHNFIFIYFLEFRFHNIHNDIVHIELAILIKIIIEYSVVHNYSFFFRRTAK